jgi:hypothetical protein
MSIKGSLKSLVGERMLGRMDYFLKPQLVDSWGGPFNGQSFRQRIFLDLAAHLPFNAIVETGTFLGTTTAFFTKTGVPVYSVEANPRFYGYASMRFRRQRHLVHLHEGDSRRFLKHLAQLQDFPTSNVFFYLDAHWEEDLPLKEELEVIVSEWCDAVVMIDDFQVPETSYGYDDYGPGKALTLTYLKSLQHSQLFTFFPTIGAEQETGRKRGCVVLCMNEAVKSKLEKISSLVAGSRSAHRQS